MVKDLLAEIFPPDVPRIVRWRLMIAGACAFMLFHVALACGLVPGFPGFAVASEVDEKIKAAVEPIYGQLGAITTQLEKGAEVQKRILTGQLASQLRDLNRLRCTTSDDTLRRRMEADIEETEQEFKQLTGDRYPLPACKDL